MSSRPRRKAAAKSIQVIDVSDSDDEAGSQKNDELKL